MENELLIYSSIFFTVLSPELQIFFSNIHCLISQTLMWGMVGFLAILYMINSDAEGYNPFLQTCIQLI